MTRSLDESRGRFAPGLLRAFSKLKQKGEPCTKCSFPMPVYPGRYPKTCPGCGEDRSAFPEQRESLDGTRQAAN